ncbi:porin [Rhizobium sp. L1K21]|uniref:porin n=1 Tax=Rhizobium sp. L1K21 TaxID=2954933 RepID=UPI002093AEFD|nr:porin [Rhizobium sp. L1K21]MCO6184705.1 porin [Rhizobium sp. L1K21]
MSMTKKFIVSAIAALSFAPMAKAADAIVAAEPEPMDYVKVCDAYGDGYFYIPGTETCMSISGYFQYQSAYGFKKRDYVDNFRSQIDLDTKNESEYGTVYSRIRVRGDSSNNSRLQGTTIGYMGIGGLELGLYTRQWSTFLFGGGTTVQDGTYGDGENQYVSYTANLGGGTRILGAIDWIQPNKAGYVLAARTRVSNWMFGGGYAYDSASLASNVKLFARVKADAVTAQLIAFYSSKANLYNNNRYKGFSVLGAVRFAATEQIDLNATAQWMEGAGYFLAGNITWNVAPGFETLAEVAYTSRNKTTTGLLRVRRSF